MTLAVLGAIVGLLFGAGVLLVAGAFAVERATLETRVLPFVPDVAWYLQHDTTAARSSLGGSRGERVPLRGVLDPLLWGGVLLVAAAAFWLSLGGDVLGHPGRLAALCAGAFAAGAAVRVAALRVSEHRARELARRDLPLLAEALSWRVAAGVGLDEALRRSASAGTGSLAPQLGEVVGALESGVALPVALEALGRSSSSNQVADFVFSLGVALERGTPVAEMLRSQTEDLRRRRSREMLRSEPARRRWVLLLAVLAGLALSVLVLVWSGDIGVGGHLGWLRR